MGSPAIFKGKKVLLLPEGSTAGDGAIQFKDGTEIIPYAGTPVGVYDGPIGSIVLDTSNGKFWVKSAAGATNWDEFYPTDDFINSSAGAGDAGKPIVLDAAGHVDATMVNDADIDHGSIGGLGDDDHTQYHTDTRGDARYYQKTEHVNASAGAGDAGKPVVLDAAGHIDDSMLNDGDISHDSLADVSIDDHHARDHAASHSDAGADEIDVKNLGGFDTAATTYLNGTGAFSTPPDNDTVYTHPNHSGEVTSTGDGAQVLDKTALSNRTDTVITASDVILFGDADDTDNLKKDTVQGILDLAGGGGETNLAANVGTGDGDIFRDKTGVTLNLKTILAGENITVTNNADEVQLDVPGDRLPPPLEFNLHGPISIPLTRFGAGSNINGPRDMTGIRIHAFESGSSGSTTVRIHRSAIGPSGAASQDVTLTANGGENTGAVSSFSLTGVAGDVFYAELVSVATGGIEDLSVECFFGSEGLMASLTVGGRNFTDLDNLKVLHARSASANSYSNFRNEDGTNYSPSGVAFRILAFRVFNNTTTDNVFQFLYGNDAAGWNTTAPTTPVYEYGSTSTEYSRVGHSINDTGAGDKNQDSMDFLVLDGKFPHFHQSGAQVLHVTIYGYEE